MVAMPDADRGRGPVARLTGVARRLLPSGQFGRAVAVLAGGTLVAQLINLVLSPVFTRLYSPRDFGILSVFASLLALWNVAGSLRYDMAIPLPEKDAVAASAAFAAGICLVGMTVVCGLFVALFRRGVAELFHVPALAEYLWLLPLGVLTIGLYQIFYFWALRRREFSSLARTRVAQSASRSVVQVGLGFWSASPLGLIIGQIVGGAWGTSTLARAAWPDRSVMTSVSRRSLADAARRYSDFPKFALSGGMINSLGLQAPSLLVAWTYGPTVAGWFALTQRIVGLPMTIVGVAVGESFWGVAPTLARDDPTEFRRLFMRTTRKLLVVAVIPTVALMALGPLAFQLVFGEAWRTAGLYAAIMAPAMLIQFAVSPLSKVSYILERQSLQLGLDTMRFVALAAVFAAASVWHLSAAVAMILMSAVLVASYIVWFAVYYRLIHTYHLVDRAGSVETIAAEDDDVGRER